MHLSTPLATTPRRRLLDRVLDALDGDPALAEAQAAARRTIRTGDWLALERQARGAMWRAAARALGRALAGRGGALALALVAGSAWAEPPPRPAGAISVVAAAPGLLGLPLDRPGPWPLVLIGDDAVAPDRRSARYADQLNAAGLATLEIAMSDAPDVGAIDAGAPEAAADLLARAAGALADRRDIDTGRIALLGFGRFAELALRDGRQGLLPGLAAWALLSPGCTAPGPGLAIAAPLLVLHGTEDPTSPPEACAALAALPGHPVRVVRAYVGAGFGWDVPTNLSATLEMLSAPGGGRAPAQPWPELAVLSAAQVAGFLAAALR